jgi:hypothetical protein
MHTFAAYLLAVCSLSTSGLSLVLSTAVGLADRAKAQKLLILALVCQLCALALAVALGAS